MKQTAYGKPLFLSPDNKTTPLEKVGALDESYIQELIFNYPECLPISDIDEAWNPAIPVCMELNTPVGPLDILLVSPNGELAIVETKLWRNPEARRVVVAQILDYAKELSAWGYEDLQREINRKLGTKGNALYELVKKHHPDLLPPEPDFVDSVSRNLARGKFLLLIAGDGIREGSSRLVEFLTSAGNLNFTFAMVELSVYRAGETGTLVVPKTIVKTVEISRMTVEVPPGFTLVQGESPEADSGAAPNSERAQASLFYREFWEEFVQELTFDDPGQPLPSPGSSTNLTVYPGKTRKAWISAYFMKSSHRVGVYFRFGSEQEGSALQEAMEDEKEAIRAELGKEVIWSWQDEDFASFGVRLPCEDVFAEANRGRIKAFFQQYLNHFVNVMRPRLKRVGG